MLAEEQRQLFNREGNWYVKPKKAAYGVMVNSWTHGLQLVHGSWEKFLDYYQRNLLQ